MLFFRLQAPPPPPETIREPAAAPPEPPAPMQSTLSMRMQSFGTVQLDPDVRKIVVCATIAAP
jgi:hypothetical protein